MWLKHSLRFLDKKIKKLKIDQETIYKIQGNPELPPALGQVVIPEEEISSKTAKLLQKKIRLQERFDRLTIIRELDRLTLIREED